MTNEFQGYRMTKRHLIVCWTRKVGNTSRFEQVSIPWDALVEDMDFVEVLSAHVAAKLRERWSMEPEDYPLF